MQMIISSQAMRSCEQANFDAGLATPENLMQIAGDGCTAELLKFAACRQYRRIVIFAGKGNNGGDGIVIADNLARAQQLPVILALAAAPAELSTCSQHFFARLDARVKIVPAAEVELKNSDIIIDALLGTGCQTPMREPYRSLINKINQATATVFAVDLPSGLGSDCCVRADFTAVIGFFKDQLFTDQGIENSGILRRVELPLPIRPQSTEKRVYASDIDFYCRSCRILPRQVHKYQRGSVVIAGGSRDYFQAPFLSGRAALRNGAGMVHLAVPFAVAPGSGTLSLITAQMPGSDGYLSGKSFEAMNNILKKADVLAVGPGMGRAAVSGEFMEQVLNSQLPLVIDADALWHAAGMLEILRNRSAAAVLTPHRGEAALLAKACNIVLSDDDEVAAQQLAGKTGSVVLLKGARTVIADPAGDLYRNSSGTPALATAGSGDVLTGLIASEIAAGANPLPQAVLRAAFLHGLAGEAGALEWGETGVIADDLAELAARVKSRLYAHADIF